MAAVMALMVVIYLRQFVVPGMHLKATLSLANARLVDLAAGPDGVAVDLAFMGREVMTNERLAQARARAHYAGTLRAQWQSGDSGPVGAARARVGQLSGAFFAGMNAVSATGRVDLSEVELLTRSDKHMALLSDEYNQALADLYQLEAADQNRAGAWQAAGPAEDYFSEHVLVDSPLPTNFFKHVPGMLTGAGSSVRSPG